MRRLALLAAVLLPACTIDRAVGPGMSVSPKLAEDCREHCAMLEMRLAAVVIAANAGGCVCEPEPTVPARAAPRASGGSGAAAAALLVAQAAARTDDAHQHSPTSPPAPPMAGHH